MALSVLLLSCKLTIPFLEYLIIKTQTEHRSGLFLILNIGEERVLDQVTISCRLNTGLRSQGFDRSFNFSSSTLFGQLFFFTLLFLLNLFFWLSAPQWIPVKRYSDPLCLFIRSNSQQIVALMAKEEKNKLFWSLEVSYFIREASMLCV